MASWVTHLMIADRVLDKVPELDRHGFCVGNIAPDCNVENEDWTQFNPPREVTHWMSAERKKASDCDRFYREQIENRRQEIRTGEEYSFLMGYYSHLITDAENERMKDIYSMEADYLEQHPDSGYFTEILSLTAFPNYIDYLPDGAIVRKVRVMGYIPKKETSEYPYIGFSREEYDCFTDRAVELVLAKISMAGTEKHIF